MITEIEDTGIGIEQERQKMLFEMFGELFQEQSISKVKDHSIGLGLACSKILAKQIQGDVELVSSTNRKTIFRIKIPIKIFEHKPKIERNKKNRIFGTCQSKFEKINYSEMKKFESGN